MTVMYFKIVKNDKFTNITYKFNRKDQKFEEFSDDIPKNAYQVIDNQINDIISIISKSVNGPRGDYYHYAEISKKDGVLKFGEEQGNYAGGILSYLGTSPIERLEGYKKSDRKFWELVVEEYAKINLKLNHAKYSTCPECGQEIEYYSSSNQIVCNNCSIIFSDK